MSLSSFANGLCGGSAEHTSFKAIYGGFYLFVFESACLQHAVMYLLDIPHTISAGILKVCPSGAIYRSSLIEFTSAFVHCKEVAGRFNVFSVLAVHRSVSRREESGRRCLE